MEKSKTHMLVQNALIASIYVVLTLVVAPVAQGPIQFRVSESLNHLVVFNKKLMWGVLSGVIFFNLFFSDGGLLDVVFGGGQTFLALAVVAASEKWLPDVRKRLVLNVVVFSLSMVLIAIMLSLIGNFPIGSPYFWAVYGSTALSEAIIMGVSAPVMYWLSRHTPLAYV
ncbi:QueT transporter family protein [Vagococcus acidifermentans]|uniref:QueT transporter family protein n=1 Tax=Vagococcus acidifermentans TaxID=564710 RepID=A0A430AWK7_9ENTE|nr:QueT transporter family protein [Vagococcus acidifermentans]RSU12440.1 hypothetical protein CBF27_05545 [Vagococcus acidifermentans]